MSDIRISREELLPIESISLLPDTYMMLSGECFVHMLPTAPHGKRGAKKQWDGGYTNSIRYSREEIEQDPILALSPEEYRTLRLHMQGLGRGEISRILGITEVGVGLRLQKKRVKEAKARLMAGVDEDLESLVGEALEVYRQGLKAPDLDTRLKAAEKIFKVNGKGLADAARKKPGDEMNAHEFMNTILQKFEANIQVNVGTANESLEGDSRRLGNTIDLESGE